MIRGLEIIDEAIRHGNGGFQLLSLVSDDSLEKVRTKGVKSVQELFAELRFVTLIDIIVEILLAAFRLTLTRSVYKAVRILIG